MAETAVVGHYGTLDLRERIVLALRAAGLGEGTLSHTDLAPLDQFHTRGLAATEELAALVPLGEGTRVLDIGSGLGGPSRYLAGRFGCTVTGIDLTPAFVDAATMLAARCGLGERVSYRVADALALPFKDADFDVAWTQHAAMNIADRARLYAEMARVLRPGGHLAVYDVVAGAGEPIYPVPWARVPEISFLLTPAAMRAALKDAGFAVLAWQDTTSVAVVWGGSPQPPASPLGLAVAMGPDFPTLAANLGRNFREGRLGVIQAVLRRG